MLLTRAPTRCIISGSTVPSQTKISRPPIIDLRILGLLISVVTGAPASRHFSRGLLRLQRPPARCRCRRRWDEAHSPREDPIMRKLLAAVATLFLAAAPAAAQPPAERAPDIADIAVARIDDLGTPFDLKAHLY